MTARRRPRETAQDRPGEAKGAAPVIPAVPTPGSHHGAAGGLPGGVWTLAIEDWLPPSVNRLLSVHWAARARMKRAAQVAISVAVLRTPGLTPPHARGKRRISLRLAVVNRSHAPDPDNVMKVLLDACVATGLLVDDAAEWCEVGPVLIEKAGRKRTEITLEDIGPGPRPAGGG